ncbi:MAG: DUF302 domain-containing protein [Gammaproteobacteria bacterium]|nr:DUF302 domain-containing protein [Gammaproteobacteria bacterium]
MRKSHWLVGLLLISKSALSSPPQEWPPAHQGLISIKSPHSVNITADRLEDVLRNSGMKVFLRIDHAVNAKKVGIDINPNQLILFGNPKVGSKLMLCAQTTGIDLPLKALVSEDKTGDVWLRFNDPLYLANRHQFSCSAITKKISKALHKFANEAISQPPYTQD